MASTGVYTFLVCIAMAVFLFQQVSSSLDDASYERTVQLWPDGEIPYVISPAFGRRRRYKILAAMKEWQQVTCLKFKPRTTERDYVRFVPSVGCEADGMGYLGKGVQTIGLARGCFDKAILLHEIGHTIGLHHEHNRPDRDKYIKVLWNNVFPKSFVRAFQISTNWHPVAMKFPYDYFSIMHFGVTDFGRGRTVLKPKEKQICLNSDIKGISALDSLKVRRMYKCPEFPDFPRDFHWSHDGRMINGTTCIKMDEPRDPKSWENNYLCYKSNCTKPLNITWSHSGPINGMLCTKITDHRKPNSTSWDDNYLCVPSNSPYKFKWLLSKPSPQERNRCRHLNEPRDRDWERGYHYLCVTDRETDQIDGQWSPWRPWGTCNRKCNGGFQFRIRKCSNPSPANGGRCCLGKRSETRRCNVHSCQGPPKFPKEFSYTYLPSSLPRGYCVRTYDLVNFWQWTNYYLCSSDSKNDPGIMWSYYRPIPGKRCTRIYNPIENRRRRGSWMNNYLCVPKRSPYNFVWSVKGPMKGLPCMRWYAQNGRKGWDKTYLCNRPAKLNSICLLKNKGGKRTSEKKHIRPVYPLETIPLG